MHATGACSALHDCPTISWESPEFGAALRTVKVPALNMSPLATPLFADTPDNLDYGAALAEAPANQAGARQRRIVCSQHNRRPFQNNSSQVGTGSSKSAEDAAVTVSDDLTAMVDSLRSSDFQHAAVDQVLDELLAEVAAPLQPVQSSMPVNTSGVSPMVSPRVGPSVRLPANLFAA